MGKIKKLYRIVDGDSVIYGTMDDIGKYFNVDAHNVRNGLYVNGTYGGCKFVEVGQVEVIQIFEATNGKEKYKGTLKEIADYIECSAKSLRNNATVKGFNITKVGKEERVIKRYEQSMS